MTVPFVSALSLRIPLPQNDMTTMLASWMDDSNSELSLSNSDCQRDLQTIGLLRKTIGETIQENYSFKSPTNTTLLSEVEEKMHEYYHYLVECESQSQLAKTNPFLKLEWESSMVANSIQTFHSLQAEKANLMWNLAALEAHQASQENLTTKPGWNKASTRLQKAASCIGHLLTYMETHSLDLQDSNETSPAFLMVWQALLMAQAQHCVYEAILCVKRPMHLLLAKLAAAAVPLYNEVPKIASQLELEFVADMVHFAKAWGAYLSCQAEHHQSQIHKEKKAWGLELARLDVAMKHAAVCKNLCDNHTTSILDELKIAVDEKLQVLQQRLQMAQNENEETHHQVIPEPLELPEIRGQNLVKSNKPLVDIIVPKTTPALFQKQHPDTVVITATVTLARAKSTTTASAKSQPGKPDLLNDDDDDDDDDEHDVVPPATKMGPPQLSTSSSSSFYQKKMAARSSPNLRTYVEIFHVEMSEIIEDLARASEDQSESARLALNEVHLPHSLRAYQQEQSGGGLPDDLWERVHVLQQENTVIQLKQDLWELKDAADLAQATHKAISSQLDYDTSTDKAFREANPDFSGHDAWDAQKSFRKPLANYDKLLSSAQDGDKVLFQRLEQLDIEPKYDLLQFSKAQLDLLLPGGKSDPDLVVGTQHLSYLCGELRTLFQKKADLVAEMRNELETFDVSKAIENTVKSTRKNDEDYLEATKHAQKHFETFRVDIQGCMEDQNELLGTILVENEAFMNSRQRTMNSQSAESCIVMIEDAMDEIDQLSKHLKEGKDFYNVVLPKLDELKQQVDDVSARLTVERLEYYEVEKKASQEQKDAEMAQQLNQEAPPPVAQTNGEESPDTKPSATEAAAARSNVDDDKMATLMAMEFDADKVVEALEKHDNNLDLALNELLSC